MKITLGFQLIHVRMAILKIKKQMMTNVDLEVGKEEHLLIASGIAICLV